MEKEIFDELPQFDRLVAGSRFEALAAGEQAVVVKYMTPGEFNEMHDLAVAEKEEALRLRNAIGPLADIREKLLAGLSADSPPVGSEGVREGSPAGILSVDSDHIQEDSQEGMSSYESERNRSGLAEGRPLSGKKRIMAGLSDGKPSFDREGLMAGRPEGSRAAGPAGSPVAYWLTRRVPLYQAAIAASLLIILLLAFLLPARFNASRLAVTDTVYIEKTIRITDTVWLPDDRDDGSPGHSVSDPGPARQPQGSAAGYRKDDAHHPGTPGTDARRQGADGLARTATSSSGRKGDAHQPGQPGDYARRQMADALARIAPLASGRPGNSFPVDADLIRLVAVQY